MFANTFNNSSQTFRSKMRFGEIRYVYTLKTLCVRSELFLKCLFVFNFNSAYRADSLSKGDFWFSFVYQVGVLPTDPGVPTSPTAPSLPITEGGFGGKPLPPSFTDPSLFAKGKPQAAASSLQATKKYKTQASKVSSTVFHQYTCRRTGLQFGGKIHKTARLVNSKCLQDQK